METTLGEISVLPVQTAILGSPNDIRSLSRDAADSFFARETSIDPEFFLASLSRNKWAPRVAVVRQAGKIAGIVYAKERLLAGIPTGMIFGDSTIATMTVAEPDCRRIVFHSAMTALLQRPHVRSLRLLVPPNGTELQSLRQYASMSFDVCHAPIDYHSVLELPSTYEGFLARLGSRTRRNFRYYREHSEAAGHAYVEDIPHSEFERIAYSLLKEGVIGAKQSGVSRALRMLAAVKRPWLVGLRSPGGEWLSIIGGWYDADRAVMFFQMNSDRKHAKLSLSLVARAHLIESLIGQGVRSLVFWAGVGDPLHRYVQPIPAVAVSVDAQTFSWRLFRRLVNSRRRWLPPKLAEWIAGPT
ncbi:MAG TPA: hypothetical protein VG168_13785 [Bryobacteraceae bacterium]|nr:hypothetical protein [Bryobacteraceae bacterium]